MTADAPSRRILFVDDAVDLLDGLRNGLRGERRQWRMRFADGGEAALRLLEEEPADVVVTDMRMPVMDGLELLRRVRQRWPDTMRVVLSGQADLTTVIQASAVAHQYLAKPCDLSVLRGVVQRGFQVLDRLPVPALRRALGGLGSLPLGPSASRALGEALAADDVDLRALAPLAEADAGVTARLLQFANSPYCGLAQQVLSVEAALVYLGTSTVRQLVATLEPFVGPEAPPVPSAHPNLVRHALLAARLTRRIAPGHPCGDAAYAAALLHQAGELVLMARMPERWAEVHQAAVQTGRHREAVEAERLGADHSRMGAYILGLWGLPAEVVDAVDRLHGHAEDAAPPSETLALVRQGAWLAQEVSGHPNPLTPEETEALARSAGDRLAEWRALATEEAAGLGMARRER